VRQERMCIVGAARLAPDSGFNFIGAKDILSLLRFYAVGRAQVQSFSKLGIAKSAKSGGGKQLICRPSSTSRLSSVLPCECKDRPILAHFHKAQLNQLGHVGLVDCP
jgi:hypothetical protein